MEGRAAQEELRCRIALGLPNRRSIALNSIRRNPYFCLCRRVWFANCVSFVVTIMRSVLSSLVIVFFATAGCGSPKASPSTPQQPVMARPDPKVEQLVRRWLAENSYAFVINHAKPNRPFVEWKTWIDRGRKIHGIELVLTSLLARRDAEVELPLVAQSLGDLGGMNSVSVLIDALGSGDIHLRIQSAIALGRLHDRRAVPALGKCLREESDENVRANLVVAIGSIGGPDAREYLEEAAKDASPFVAELADEGLDLFRMAEPGEEASSGGDGDPGEAGKNSVEKNRP